MLRLGVLQWDVGMGSPEKTKANKVNLTFLWSGKKTGHIRMKRLLLRKSLLIYEPDV